MKVLIASVALAAALTAPGSVAAPDAEAVYRAYCIACHGADMDKGMGGSLVDAEWKYATTDEEMVALIKAGIPEKGMVPYGKILKEEQINALVELIRARARPASPGKP